METQNPQSPSWNEIFKEVGLQLKSRSGLLSKRVLLVISTVLLVFIGARLLFFLNPSFLQNSSIDSQIEIVFWVTLGIIFITITTIISMAIAKIERTVWLDSYFDGEKLTPEESWKISKKLYLPWSKLQSKLFLKYYSWIFVAGLGLFLLLYILMSDFGRQLSVNFIIITWSSLFIITGISLIFWTRYLKIKLSYAPFVFLDMYNGSFTEQFWSECFSELEKLNKVSEGESFKKNVLLELGADASVTLIQFISTQMRLGFGLSIIGLAGKEVGIRIIYYAKLTGRYVLYRFAFKNIHGNTHHVNQFIYSLRK